MATANIGKERGNSMAVRENEEGANGRSECMHFTIVSVTLLSYIVVF